MNILLITGDQWRGDCLGCAGHPVVKTPNLDKLAAQGVRFARHYCQATPCGPSRASLYTGMYPLNHRVVANGTPLDQRHTNFAIELRRVGYDPVLSGYTDTTPDPRAAEGPDDQTLHYKGDALRGLRTLNSHPGGHSGHLANSWAGWLEHEHGYDVPASMDAAPGEPYSTAHYAAVGKPGCVLGGDPEPAAVFGAGGAAVHAIGADGCAVAAFHRPEHSSTAFVVEQAMEHVSARRGQRWCCHLSSFWPHPPWLASEPFNRMYSPADGGLPAHRAASPEVEGALHPWLKHRLSQSSVAPEDDEAMALSRSQYYATITETDAALGRLFDWLQERGDWANTLVVFTTDHGEQFGDHWLMNKDGFFEQSYHIPLIVRHPSADYDGSRGRTVESVFTENVDVMPTMLEAVGAKVPAQVDGVSLLPFLRGGGEPQVPAGWRDAAHWEFDYRDRNPPAGTNPYAAGLTVHRGLRWKYVHFADPRYPPLLFDMDADGGAELADLAGSPDAEHQAALVECMSALLGWRMRHSEHVLTHFNNRPDGGSVQTQPTLHEQTARM